MKNLYVCLRSNGNILDMRLDKPKPEDFCINFKTRLTKELRVLYDTLQSAEYINILEYVLIKGVLETSKSPRLKPTISTKARSCLKVLNKFELFVQLLGVMKQVGREVGEKHNGITMTGHTKKTNEKMRK